MRDEKNSRYSIVEFHFYGIWHAGYVGHFIDSDYRCGIFVKSCFIFKVIDLVKYME